MGDLLAFALQNSEEVIPDDDDIEIADADQNLSEVEQSNPDYLELPNHVPMEFIDAVIDRVLRSPDPRENLAGVAQLICRRLGSHDKAPMPMALDLVDASGAEPTHIRELRYDLVEALLRYCIQSGSEFDRYFASVITRHWRNERPVFGWQDDDALAGYQRAERVTLLDDDDFAWSLDRIDHHRANGDEPLAEALGALSSVIGDLYNRATFDRAYERRNQPEWSHFRWMYEGVDLNGQLAQAMKTNGHKPQAWDGAGDFAAAQQQRLESAAAGDSNAFWQFVHILTADPATGRFEYTNSDDIRAFVGTSLWSDEALHPLLRKAASCYALAEDDHRETWLGTATFDRRANAGYLALALLHREGVIQDLPDDTWASWAGTVLERAGTRASAVDTDVANELLQQVARHASPALADATRQLVRTSLANGQSPGEIPATDSLFLAPSLRTVLLGLASEIVAALNQHNLDTDGSQPPATDQATLIDAPVTLYPSEEARRAAVETWASILRAPLASGDSAAIQQVEAALHSDTTNNTMRGLAAAAGQLLLTTDATESWPQVGKAIAKSSEFARELALLCSSSYRIFRALRCSVWVALRDGGVTGQ
ncbi:MAG: hypothetical protein ACRD2X_10200, partial [Vicinamibacteraceae bacterium]